MAITLRDVAARAGVSVATASRSLHSNRPVTPRIAGRVRVAADELGYHRNVVAGALRRQVSDTVGLVVPQISNPFFPLLVESIEEALASTGRGLLLANSQMSTATERACVESLLSRQVDGLVISPSDVRDSRDVIAWAAERVPLVQVDRWVDGNLTDWVGIDDDAALARLVEHVAAAGARTISFVSAQSTTSSSRLRLSAFDRAVAADPTLRVHSHLLGTFDHGWGVQAAQRLLAGGELPDAIVCGNDVIALGVVRALLRAVVSIPDEVMVTGFDDIDFAAIANPSLTTVRQPHAAMARECLRLLDVGQQPDEPNQHIAITPELIVRESTGGRSEDLPGAGPAGVGGPDSSTPAHHASTKPTACDTQHGSPSTSAATRRVAADPRVRPTPARIDSVSGRPECRR